MRGFGLLLLPLALFAVTCAGGSSRYGCPAKSGYSCKSVSEVYAEATSGRSSAEDPFYEFPGNKKSARAGGDTRKNPPKGRRFRPGKDKRDNGEAPGAGAGEEKTMPVYLPPRVIRLWIAPWQDTHGVFHSEKYVYLLAGKGRWTLRGKTVPIGEPGEEYPGEIRLRGTERAP